MTEPSKLPSPHDETLSTPPDSSLPEDSTPVDSTKVRVQRRLRGMKYGLELGLLIVIAGAFGYGVSQESGLLIWIILPVVAIIYVAFRFKLKERQEDLEMIQQVEFGKHMTAKQILAQAGLEFDEESLETRPLRPEPRPEPRPIKPMPFSPRRERLREHQRPSKAVKPKPKRSAPERPAIPLATGPEIEATVLSDSPPPPVVPDPSWPRIEEYEILRELGRGGMGSVYEARHKRFGRIVALKTILKGRQQGRAEVARFQAEVHSAARLNHPGIVPVYEAGEADDQHYFTMALVDGDSLADRIKRGPIEPNQAAFIVGQTAEAVAFAHRQGVIHRDIKPGNILLDRNGTVRVADFGLARQLDATDVVTDLPADLPFVETFHTVARLTVTGAVMGTPAYMAPEQALDTKRAKEGADVWALGAVLYACLTGRPPFIGSSVMETLTLVIEADPPSLRELAPQVDSDLEAICLKCLVKDPLQRYLSAEDLVADLARWRSGRTPQAARLDWLEQARRWDAAFPEVLPLATGVVAPWLCGVQEGIFLGTALVGARLEAHWPTTRRWMRTVFLWASLIAGPTVLLKVLEFGPLEATRLILWGNVMYDAVVGGLLGALLAVGSQTAANYKHQWTFHLTLWTALTSAVGLWFGFKPLQNLLRSSTNVTLWEYHSLWGSYFHFSKTSFWLMLVALSCGIVIGLISVSARIRRSAPLNPRPTRLGGLLATTGWSLVAIGMLLPVDILLAGVKPYAYIRLANGMAGPLSAALLVSLIGFSTGTLLSGIVRHCQRGHDALRQQSAFVGRLAAAGAGLVTLAAVMVWMPDGPAIKLDVSGYFGPGPLLTTLERGVGEKLGMPASLGWGVIFLGKFVLLTIPMIFAAIAAVMLTNRRRRT